VSTAKCWGRWGRRRFKKLHFSAIANSPMRLPVPPPKRTFHSNELRVMPRVDLHRFWCNCARNCARARSLAFDSQLIGNGLLPLEHGSQLRGKWEYAPFARIVKLQRY